jgi:hypothetical protein
MALWKRQEFGNAVKYSELVGDILNFENFQSILVISSNKKKDKDESRTEKQE